MNRITQFLERPAVANHSYECDCNCCRDCLPNMDDVTVTVSGMPPTDEQQRLALIYNGWQPIGDGYYHRDIGTVRPVPPCEDAEIVEATELQRCAVVAIVVSVILGYASVLVAVAWILGKLVG